LKARIRWRSLADSAARLRLVVAIVAALMALAAAAVPFVPASDDQVLERLPFAATDPAMRALRGMRATLSREPGNLTLALQVARRYYELGRVTGDPRYSGYAQAALAPWWELADPPREVRLLRASLRQRVHDFDAALADLSVLIALEPRNGQALLTRATVLQVRGEYSAAARDCAALQGVANELAWAACAYGLDATTGRVRASYDALAATLERHPEAAADVRGWVLSILAEMAARAGLAAAAEAHFRAALALDPADHYTRGAFADFLLDAGRPADVVALLDGRLSTDALLLCQALALKALRSPALPARIGELRLRFEASRLRGDRVHQREEARFSLHLLGDANASLSLAQQNWAVQKELPDLRILLEAAQAAGDAAARRMALDWIARTGIEDVQLSRLKATSASAPRR
jgi:hypothetical protein